MRPSDLWRFSKWVYQREGIRGFYRGGSIAAIKSSIGFGVFFNGIQTIPRLLGLQIKSDGHYIHNHLVNFITGSSAMFFTTLISTPLTVLKTRFEIVGKSEYKSIRQAVRKIHTEEGIKGFYRGILPTLMRDIPCSGAQYSIYCSIKGMYTYFNPGGNASDSTPFVFIAGGVSSVIAIMVLYPFDNIRVRCQGVRMENQSQTLLELVK